MTKRLTLLFATLVVVFLGSLGLDRFAGLFLAPHGQGLIFPRNVNAKLNTPEFSSIIKTNSLGFRDREFTAQKSVRLRVVAIGDSFTFGWGVEAEESWPRVLENQLRSAGLDSEVANLGKPGGSPTNYADIAEKSCGVLHPDLLIVAVLQGDDLAQMGFPLVGDSKLGREADNLASWASSHSALRRITRRLYPNLLTMIDGTNGGQTDLAKEWRSLASASFAGLTPVERTRFDQLDGTIKKAFFAGELNPSLVYLGVHAPDYFMETMNLNSPITKSHISQMADQLKRIKSVADRNNTKVIVASVPYGIYVSDRSFETRQRIGFSAIRQMLTANEPDEAIKQATRLAGIDFCEVTSKFRAASANQQLFFDLDGHFNRAGHQVFAESLAPFIHSYLNATN